jgi:hypothetical protein
MKGKQMDKQVRVDPKDWERMLVIKRETQASFKGIIKNLLDMYYKKRGRK